MRNLKCLLSGLILTFFANQLIGQKNISVLLNKPVADIQPTMWGIFFEDINFAADGGIYAELIKNRSFEFKKPMMGWRTVKLDGGEGEILILNHSDKPNNPRHAHMRSENAEGKFGIVNEGFRGLPIRESIEYRFSVTARNNYGSPITLIIQLLDSEGTVAGETELKGIEGDWRKYEATLQSSITDAKGKIKVLIEGKGQLDMDMVSLFPKDTYKERENGLRADIVKMLEDLEPGFVRFPGGCIVEGHELENRYQWKKSVGNLEDRELSINRWNFEFKHRDAPDYFQSFGLGFYEYFLLSEDLGAEPLPIINCGMACQYNTGELVPLDKLGPYVQDALDLIEFANGSVDSKWGKVRADMGHPEPFNLKYIGIGNEQWGHQYVERYPVFAKAIREKYPEIQLISGSGPRPNDDRFKYLWKHLPNLDVDIVDEHFYMDPGWFQHNAKRYDSFDRNGPILFPGEYAAHGPAGEYPSSRNTWLSALSEAAFMTGFERNADIVHMCSYAPLLAHINAWQWRPDLIWFDNLNVFGTPNYYVHKLYATHKGTNVVPALLEDEAITGQDSLYASTTIDQEKKQAYIKLVNTSKETIKTSVTLKGGASAKKTAVAFVMQADDLLSYNSIEEPTKIAPVERTVDGVGKYFTYDIAPQSFNLIVLDLK